MARVKIMAINVGYCVVSVYSIALYCWLLLRTRVSLLASNVFSLHSSFDEYVTEVKSGRLEWSPVHKEIRFWRENAHKLNDMNYELLK